MYVKFMSFIILCLSAMLIYTFIGLSNSMATEKKCLDHGYAGSRLTYDFEGYCLKTDDFGAIIITKEKDLK